MCVCTCTKNLRAAVCVEIVNINGFCVHVHGKNLSVVVSVETVNIDAILETKLIIWQHPANLHMDYVHHRQQDLDLVTRMNTDSISPVNIYRLADQLDQLHV